MIPAWLNIVSLASLGLAASCALWIALDCRRHPQKMGIMNLVWPLSALFGSVLLLWFYLRYGRAGASEKGGFAVAVGKGALHCGSGCTLGDILAETLAVTVPAVLVPLGYPGLFGDRIFAIWILDFIFAFVIGIVFQYFAIAPMRGLGLRDGILAALRADALSLTAWQVGMYGLMAIAYFRLFPAAFGVRIDAGMPVFWLVMQFAMLAGSVTAYPVNWWLIRKGWKEEM
jgi:hypothetical protein